MGFKVDMSGAKDKIRAICTDPKVGETLATDFERLVRPYVPRREDILRPSAVISPFLVTWTAPYAHYQWSGVVNDENRTTANTYSHWEEWVPKDELARDMTEYLKGM